MTPTPRPHLRVAVVIEASNAYGRGLLAGILRHVREQAPWTIFLPEHGRGAPPLEALARYRGDGVIRRIETSEIVRAIAAARSDRRRRRHRLGVAAWRLPPAAWHG